MKSPVLRALMLGSLLLGGTAYANDAANVRASQAWIRVLPGALPAGGYVTLENHGDRAVALKGATSTNYAEVMLHESSTAGGMARMKMVDSMAIPAHGKAVLAPAGYHLMLMQPNTPVKPGDVVNLVLQFTDGSTLATDFVARPANALDAGEAHDGHAAPHHH